MSKKDKQWESLVEVMDFLDVLGRILASPKHTKALTDKIAQAGEAYRQVARELREAEGKHPK